MKKFIIASFLLAAGFAGNAQSNSSTGNMNQSTDTIPKKPANPYKKDSLRRDSTRFPMDTTRRNGDTSQIGSVQPPSTTTGNGTSETLNSGMQTSTGTGTTTNTSVGTYDARTNNAPGTEQKTKVKTADGKELKIKSKDGKTKIKTDGGR